ncbi:alpha/beta hydrolase [Smaragdicoccus niigatensis]|uniref:alpha/beta hydrolase n=1 Tax=Smaragdicoccus niigatensis TaxID=359359 RepID=UPI0003A391AB|nr:alpha/beta hydrolase family protein [Smaragdicoccus niigatensis]
MKLSRLSVLRRLATPVLAVAAAVTAMAVAPGQAQAWPGSGAETHYIYSPSMGRAIQTEIWRNAGGGPIVYLLNGMQGGTDGLSWGRSTPARQFFANKHVTVVNVIDGSGSFYANWRSDRSQQWETYFTKELPPVLNKMVSSNGKYGIIGLSHSGLGAMNMLGKYGMFQAGASLSGCPQTADIGTTFMHAAEDMSVGRNIFNMYGGPGDPSWAYNDPTMHPERFRGKTIFLTAASGVPGPPDDVVTPGMYGGPAAVEAITKQCTQNFSNALNSAGVRHGVYYYANGAHTWGLFYNELVRAWSYISPRLS